MNLGRSYLITTVRKAAELSFLGIRILPLGTYLDIHISKIEAARKYKIVNLRPPNVDAAKLSFTYVLKLEISVKK